MSREPTRRRQFRSTSRFFITASGATHAWAIFHQRYLLKNLDSKRWLLETDVSIIDSAPQVRVHVILRAQFGKRLFALDRRQGHFRLECCRVISSGTFHFCSQCAHCAFSFEQNFHLSACPNFQHHLCPVPRALRIRLPPVRPPRRSEQDHHQPNAAAAHPPAATPVPARWPQS